MKVENPVKWTLEKGSARYAAQANDMPARRLQGIGSLARGGFSGNGSKQRTIVKRGKAEGSRNETLRRGVKITD